MASASSVSFGDLLRRYRVAAGLTQEELAERAHLSVDAVSTLERGMRRAPRKATVSLLADALALQPEDRAVFVAAARQHTTLDAATMATAPEVATAGEGSFPAVNRVELHSKATGSLSLPEDLSTPAHSALPSGVKHSIAVLPVRQKARIISGTTTGLLISLSILVIIGCVLGAVSLGAHYGILGEREHPPALGVVRGGTWTDESFGDASSLLANGPISPTGSQIEQALYLPLFYGDAHGVLHAGAATVIPTVQNGGISADATTWTFHLRPHLVWSDGQPYDARDVAYTLKLRLDHALYARIPIIGPIGLELIRSVDISSDNLSITFHLKQAYVPFLQYWADGIFAPLPAHHLSSMAPDQIIHSPDNLNPQVVSGPFKMAESVPGDHYTLVRNPRYYRAREGLPYLDKVVFHIGGTDTFLKDLQTRTFDSAYWLDQSQAQTYHRLHGYTLISPPTTNGFEALYFNFHNAVLASHLEVRQAMAMAVDHQAMIQASPLGLATLLCTDHGSFYHPGYDPAPPCPPIDPAAANKLLDDTGWVRGPDGVRSQRNERLEFEYSVATGANILGTNIELAVQRIVQRNMQAIGIKLDIQNYDQITFFGAFLQEGNASPPTGAVAGRYDIAEFGNYFGYDPDDSSMLACDQIYPYGGNIDFYCNPALDALYRQELTTVDAGVRQQIFDQIHRIYLTQFPFITLYSSLDLYLVRTGLHNYKPSPYTGEAVNIWEWWCDKGTC